VRQTQGSVVCAQCGRLVGVNEEKCPFCGAWRPGLFGWATVLRRTMGGRIDLFNLIVATCVTLYALALLLQPEAILQGGGLLSIFSPGGRALYQLGLTGGLAWDQGWWLTLLTAIYLHGSLLHILFNMMWIRNLGPEVASCFGAGRAFLIFNLAGAGGFLASNVASGVPTIGASGSIFGLLAALIVYGRRRGSVEITRQLWQYAIILGVFGFIMPGINNWAHGGGFATGWLVAQAVNLDDDRQDGSWVLLSSLGLIVLTLVGVGFSFVRVTSILLS